MSLLWLLCHYYITFLCRFNARPKKFARFALEMRVAFLKCSMSSLAVVFFLRPFLWGIICGILAFRIVETVCKPFTLFHSKWETKLRYQDQLNHPTPRMTRKLLCCILPHVPWASLHPTIFPVLWKERGYAMSFIVFKMVCHFSMVTSQNIITQTSLHLNIHSLLRMLQYLWHGEGIIYTYHILWLRP